MEINQLEALIAIVEEKGFSRAGDRLHRTQPAISQAIQRLEKDIGTKLLDRSAKDGTLTPAGKVIFEYAKQILALRRNARAEIQDLKSLQYGKVIIGANEYTVQYLLPIVLAFRQKHPQIKVEIKRSLASRIPAEIVGRDIEIGVTSYRPANENLYTMEVASDEIVLIAPPGRELTNKQEIPIGELGTEPFVAHNVRSPYRDQVIQAFEKHRTPLNIILELPTLEAIKQAVEQGLGLALIPRLAARYELERGQIVAYRVSEIDLKRQLYLIHADPEGLSHASRAFIKTAGKFKI